MKKLMLIAFFCSVNYLLNAQPHFDPKKYYDIGIQYFHQAKYDSAEINLSIAKKMGYKADDLEAKLQVSHECNLASQEVYSSLQAGLINVARVYVARILGRNPFDKKAQNLLILLNEKLRNNEFKTVLVKGGRYYDKTIGDFFISSTEVTVAEYCRFLNEAKPSETEILEWITLDKQIIKSNGQYLPIVGMENFPVVYISWKGAMAFVKYYNFDLPSVDEWKWAALANYKNIDLNEMAWQKHNSNGKLHPVANKKAINGIYDMWGNAWEWTSSNHKNPAIYYGSDQKIVKGGSYGTDIDANRSNENYYNSYERLPNVSFRYIKRINLDKLKGKTLYN